MLKRNTLFYAQNETTHAYKQNPLFMFDLDGTLVDSEGVYADALQSVLKQKFDVCIPYKTAYEYVCGHANQYVFEFVKSNHSISESDKTLFLISYEKEYIELLKTVTNWLITPTVNLFKSLVDDNYAVCIVSGSSREVIGMAIEKMGYKKESIPFIGNEDYINSKPNPEPYLKASEKIFKLSSNDHHRVIIFEDSISGVKAGLAANMYVIGLQHSSLNTSLKEVGAHHVLMQSDIGAEKETIQNNPFNLRKWLDNHINSDDYQRFVERSRVKHSPN